MKVTGIILLVSGLFFLLYIFFADQNPDSYTISWAPWVGMLVLITGGISYYIARDEE
jgi:uncharacterized integral membrane protein